MQVSGRWGGQKAAPPCHIFRRAPATSRNTLADLTLALRVGSERDVEIGIHVARGDGVDVDALAGPLVAQRFGQSCDSMFARGIGWYCNAGLDKQKRGDGVNF